MATHWWELEILCDQDFEDLIFWRLDSFGCQGMSGEWQSTEKTYVIRAYVSQTDFLEADFDGLLRLLARDAVALHLSQPSMKWHLIEDEDWSKTWKRHWQPQATGDRLLVCPAWLEPPEDSNRLLLRLDPGSAFGTGSHPTTQLCLEALEMSLVQQPEAQVIADIGCGSGILSIGALLLGAKQAYGVDTDELAIAASRSNCQLNGLDLKQMVVAQGSIDTLSLLHPEPFDGLVCNILAEIIIDLIPMMAAIAKPTSWGILSGILADQVQPIADTLEHHGWAIADLQRQEQWCCFQVHRQ